MEQGMAYIVVYQREDGSSGLEECADIDLAIVTAERLRNVESIERPRIFKTEEITYDFKPYYRVEVMSEGDSDASDSAESGDTPPDADEESSDDVGSDTDVDQTDEEVAVDDDLTEEDEEHLEEDLGDDMGDDEPEVADDEEGESSGDTPTVTTGGGLFGDRGPISDRFPSSGNDDNDPPSSTRRGLFGR